MGSIVAITALLEALKQRRTMRLAMAGHALDNIPMLGMASGATQLIVLSLALLKILQRLGMACSTGVSRCFKRIRDHQWPVHRVAA